MFAHLALHHVLHRQEANYRVFNSVEQRSLPEYGPGNRRVVLVKRGVLSIGLEQLVHCADLIDKLNINWVCLVSPQFKLNYCKKLLFHVTFFTLVHYIIYILRKFIFTIIKFLCYKSTHEKYW